MSSDITTEAAALEQELPEPPRAEGHPALTPGDDPAVRSPLAHLHGEAPPAPPWFVDAIEMVPERSFFTVEGARIELLAWGDRGKPGILFLHGNGAHADWWSFIAPFFAEDFRCAAISWSGMGRSDWRETYTFPVFVQEMLAGCEAAGLFEAGEKPVVVAHSFGGGVATHAANRVGERFSKVIVLDAGVRPPALRWKGPPSRHAPNKVYPTLEAALARFRLAPAQKCDNDFILDFIARQSLHPAPLDASEPDGERGWTWRFDPFIWTKMNFAERVSQEDELAGAKCPIAFIRGERSTIMNQVTADYTRAHAPPGTPIFAMPQADHHLLLDQPLALVSTLRALLAGWGLGAGGWAGD